MNTTDTHTQTAISDAETRLRNKERHRDRNRHGFKHIFLKLLQASGARAKKYIFLIR